MSDFETTDVDKFKRKSEPKENWERSVLEKLAMAQISEARTARRWGIFFKSLAFLYLLTFLVLMIPDDFTGSQINEKKDGVTAIIEIQGIIADDAEASADNVISGLRDAFEYEHTKAVIVRINSPGGSPVQSSYIHDEIVRLSEKHEDIPVYAVVADICASGGYYIASAADQIYVNKSSIVGSIGVLMDSYGFVDSINKLGVERRLMTAGEHKGIMDPFSPVKEFEKNHLQNVLDELHLHFIDAVKTGRGNRLKDDGKIFSGLFWSGEKSIELGLADGLGSSSYVAREIVQAEKLKDFTRREDVFERFAERFGASISESILKMTGFSSGPSFR
jgi:protease-4